MLATLLLGSFAAAEPAASEPAAAQVAPGVTVTFESLRKDAPAAANPDSRSARLVALFVREGEAPTPFTPAGPFRATFETDVNLRLRDFLSFSAQGRGHLTLSLNGKPILDVSGDDLSAKATELTRVGKGKNHLVAVYESPATGDAVVRVLWSSRSFRPEPLPTTVLTHDVSTAPLVQSTRVRDGRFLLTQFRCLKCHTDPAGTVEAGHAPPMPELASDAPSLKDAGARLKPEWIAAWVNNPHEFRRNAHMPRLFHAAGSDGKPDSRAADVAAYFASLAVGDTPAAAPADEKTVAAGGRLYTNLNCVACHTPPDAGANADESRIPLKYVKAKYKPAALKAYLLKPEGNYAWTPMPNFRLSDEEASALAAFLLSFEGAAVPPGAGGDAQRGKQLVQSSGCANCHDTGLESTLKTTPLAGISRDAWAKGCLAADDGGRGAAPDFKLSDDQRASLAAFGQTDRASLKQDAAPEFADRQMTTLGCTACHARDGKPSLLATTLDPELTALRAKYPSSDPTGESFSPDQRAPLLTWAGEKLRTEWAAAFIGGKIPYKPRYYLRARMPAFASRATLLAAGLAEEHGFSVEVAPNPAPDMAMAEIGRKLAGKTPNESFSCIQCHAVGAQPPLAPFEAPAPNYMYVTERLRKDYYFRWTHDPLRIDPETKMPRYDDADGKTGVLTILDGDAHKQFDALWQYFLLGKNIQPPQQ